MPTVKINGTDYEFPEGINILKACNSIGAAVPHFCYHPALSIVGSCRMCKVEAIQGKRRWVELACNLIVADGLEILTDSEPVLKARQMTLEFLLANHPLDCPICDDAGECSLQNYYLKHGKHPSRLHEERERKRKAFDIGEKIVLDSERCVLCTRCVRFLSEVTHTNELEVFGMGSHEELMVRPGARVDNDYAGNIVDLCPVGALTDKDFRFVRRVWYLKSAESICQNCSRGCNVRIDYDVNEFHEHKKNIQMRKYRTERTELSRIQRIKPRHNAGVNGHWICDHGRYGFRSTDNVDRVLHPMLRKDEVLEVGDMNLAIEQIASGIAASHSNKNSKLAILVSPALTSEELFAIWYLFDQKLKIRNIDHQIPLDAEWYGDDLLRTPDPFPNRSTCEWLNLSTGENGIGVNELADAISNGRIDSVIGFHVDPTEFIPDKYLKKLKRFYIIASNLIEDSGVDADVIIPAAAWGEYKGIFANYEGRIQRLTKAFDPVGESLPVWKIVSLLAAALKKPMAWKNHADVFKDMCNKITQFSGLTWENIGTGGVNVSPEEIKVRH